MERLVTFEPAYDKRDPDARKNYGIHGVNLRMVLKGERGAVQFVLYTNWQLPHVQDEMLKKAAVRHDLSYLRMMFAPSPADLGYHSLTPHYEDQPPHANCEYLDGRPCYYDGSGLNADRIYGVLLAEGSDGVWRELQEYYAGTFGELI